jgi:hypothetical protein
MSFVNHYLPYFRQQLICSLLLAGYFCRLCLLKVHMESCPSHLFQWRSLSVSYFCRLCLLKVHVKSSSLLNPFSGVLKAPHHLCCVSFSVPGLFSFFWGGGAGVCLSRGLYWFIPGVAVGVPCAACLLSCWSMSPKQVWSQHLQAQEPSCFLSVTWYGKALHRLGAQGVGVLLILGGFSCQVWLHHLSMIFDLQSSHLLPSSSHHLGSPYFIS